MRQVLRSSAPSFEVKQGGRTHLWQEFDCFMWDGMIDDTIESYWTITDKKDHKQSQKLTVVFDVTFTELLLKRYCTKLNIRTTA